MEEIVIEQGPRELLPTTTELWKACRRGIEFDEELMFANPFLKSAAGLVAAYRRCAAIQIEADQLSITWPPRQPVPTAMTVQGPHAEDFAAAHEEILGYLLTIDLDAERLLPRPRIGAELHNEPFSAVIGRFTHCFSTAHSDFGYPINGLATDQTSLIDAERAYSALTDALAAGDVYVQSSVALTERYTA